MTTEEPRTIEILDKATRAAADRVVTAGTIPEKQEAAKELRRLTKKVLPSVPAREPGQNI